MRRFARGFSLVEMVVVLTVMTTLLGVATQMVHRAMQCERRSRETRAAERTALAVATQLRADAGAAIDADVDEGNEITLRCPGTRRILWSAEGGRLTRLEPRGEAMRREIYEFSDAGDYRCDLVKQGERIDLVVTRTSPRDGQAVVVLQLSATPGRLAGAGFVPEDAP